MKKKEKHECPWCHRNFATDKGLSIHRTQKRHWGLPTPPKPATEHVNYKDLIGGNWGREMTDLDRKHPTKEELSLGALFVIIDLLKDIRDELRRTKTIS